MMNSRALQTGSAGSRRRSVTREEVWLRISAFLSSRSPNTQETYAGIIREWCGFLGAPHGSAEAAERILRASDLDAIKYRDWLDRRPGQVPRELRRGSPRPALPSRSARAKKVGLEATLSNATIAKKFAALRRIYRMLIGVGLGSRTNPFDSDIVPPPPKNAGKKRPTEMIQFDLVKKIIAGADPRTPKGLRDRCILCVLFGGALRRSEVAALRVGDIRRSRSGTVFLYLRSTKAKRDAEQALPKWAAAPLTELAKRRAEEGAGSGDYLLVSYTGRGGKVPTPEPVSASGIYKLFKEYCRKAGAGDFVTPHSARATAITRLLDEGIPHRQVQEFSRHSSIQMVEVYDKRRIGVDRNPGKTLDFD